MTSHNLEERRSAILNEAVGSEGQILKSFLPNLGQLIGDVGTARLLP
jgi:hypothetical protein